MKYSFVLGMASRNIDPVKVKAVYNIRAQAHKNIATQWHEVLC